MLELQYIIDYFISCAKLGQMIKGTYQPKKIKRARKHGFLVRMLSRNGQRALSSRRAKGRRKLTV